MKYIFTHHVRAKFSWNTRNEFEKSGIQIALFFINSNGFNKRSTLKISENEVPLWNKLWQHQLK